MLLREATPALILTLASAAPAFLLLFWRAFFTLDNCQQQSSWLPSSWGCGLGRGLCAYAGGDLAPDQSLSLVLIALAAIALVCGGGSDLYRVLGFRYFYCGLALFALPALGSLFSSLWALLAAPPIEVMGVPVINSPELFAKLVNSIDTRVHTLVLVHNRDIGQPNAEVAFALQKLSRAPPPNVGRVVLHSHPHNVGVSGAWNQVMLCHRSPVVYIVNADVSFRPFALRRMAAAVAAAPHACVWTFGEGYSAFAISSKSIALAGAFDENFYPAYAEDCDYSERLRRLACPVVDTRLPLAFDHKRSSAFRTTTSNASSLWKVVTKGQPNADYVKRKWQATVPELCSRCMTTAKGGALVRNAWQLDAKRRHRLEGPRTCVACVASRPLCHGSHHLEPKQPKLK